MYINVYKLYKCVQICIYVRKSGTVMTTSAVLGIFRRNEKTRNEFLAHVARRAPSP